VFLLRHPTRARGVSVCATKGHDRGCVVSVLKFIGSWAKEWQAAYEIPKGYLLLAYEPKYRKNVGKALVMLDKRQHDKLPADYTADQFIESLKDLTVTIEIHYQKRSMSANNLMWALYEIEANELNGHRQGADNITPQQIYKGDMEAFAPRLYMQILQKDIEFLRRSYSMIKVGTGVRTNADPQVPMYPVCVYVTSSHYNTREMHDHLEMIFDRLSEAGVHIKETAEISHYWLEWRQQMNDEKTVLHTDLYTTAEYKELVKNCEACGVAVWHEDIGSSCAHIKAVGMGGHRVNKYPGSEIMHLCDKCHMQFDSGKGRDKFLEEWPHLTYKIETALRRTV